ncbi:hypothetical protein LCGC14_0692900 [marine sediment metagenome]|uniref:Uncharacterized protein n=1 Tax=marine sediment metagenome TaxID=412755 RepID=A0A0F9QPT8_9ZZZZ
MVATAPGSRYHSSGQIPTQLVKMAISASWNDYLAEIGGIVMADRVKPGDFPFFLTRKLYPITMSGPSGDADLAFFALTGAVPIDIVTLPLQIVTRLVQRAVQHARK